MIETILNRRSIRKYKDIEISDDDIYDLLKAAMAAPSAGNAQEWDFIVVKDKSIIEKITEIHPYSKMLLNSSAAIVVCGDTSREVFEGFWVQDCSAATENILLAAQSKGLGAVWLGIYPLPDRISGIKALLNLPDTVIPLSIVSVGYPDEAKPASHRFDKSKIHLDIW